MEKLKLVSYCLFTYNQEMFIGTAVKSALAQTYSNLEIIISDDASTDRTFEVIKELVSKYSGPHKIIINRNKSNLGLGQHFSTIVNQFASGEYIVVLAGDDSSFPIHVEKAIEYISKEPNFAMVDFYAENINENGDPIFTHALQFTQQRFYLNDYLSLNPIKSFAPGRIFKKELITSFEPINSDCPTEDSVLVFRSLLYGGFLRVNEKLVNYRQHTNNISKSLSQLSNQSIVNQYKKDVNYLFMQNKISASENELLLKRLNLELTLRKLKYFKAKNKLHKVIKLCILKFRMQLFKVQNGKYKTFKLENALLFKNVF